MEGFIVLHRKMLEWEWYDDTNMVRLWLHLLFKANYKNMSWHRKIIKRGQLVTGREELARQTGLSVQQVRTCLDKLVECGCITKKTTNKYTLITICKYSIYQDIPNEDNQQITNKQPTNNQQITTSKQRNNNNISSSSHARESEGWVTKDKIPELSDIWIEEVQRMASEQMKVILSPDDVREHYKEFVAQEASETLKDSYQEWRRHFSNYVRKRLKAIKDETSTANRQHLSRDEQRKREADARKQRAAEHLAGLVSTCT